MRRSSYGTVEFDEMVMSMIQTVPAISDVMDERDLLGDNEYEGGGEGKVVELGLTCVWSLDAGDWFWTWDWQG